MPRSLPLLLALPLALGCGATTTPTPADGGVDAVVAPFRDLGPETDAQPVPAATIAVVSTADFMGGTGTLATVGLADRKVQKGIDNTLGADSAVRAMGGKVFALLRPDGPLRVYDPAQGWKSPVEIKLAKGSNPHDLLLVPATSKVYLTLYNNDAAKAIGVVDLQKPGDGVGKYVAIPQAAADSDGKPEANDLHFCGGLVYVTLQDLKSFKPSGPGRIAVVDPAKDEVAATIALLGPNPNGFAVDGGGCDRVLVAAAGDQFGAVDGKGGIERVDLSLRKSLGLVIKDSDLAGHPSAVATRSPTLAFAALSVAAGTKVVAFDPLAGKLLAPVLPTAGFAPVVAVSPDGQLFVGVQTPEAMSKKPLPGLYVGPADGTMLPQTPLDLGQGPYSITFY